MKRCEVVSRFPPDWFFSIVKASFIPLFRVILFFRLVGCSTGGAIKKIKKNEVEHVLFLLKKKKQLRVIIIY